MLIGRSVHSVESARTAVEQGIDYLIAGTVFPSASHPGEPTSGTKLIADITSEFDVSVIGIGGITTGNAAQLMAAGATGVAVIGAIIGATDPYSAASELAQSIGL